MKQVMELDEKDLKKAVEAFIGKPVEKIIIGFKVDPNQRENREATLDKILVELAE